MNEPKPAGVRTSGLCRLVSLSCLLAIPLSLPATAATVQAYRFVQVNSQLSLTVEAQGNRDDRRNAGVGRFTPGDDSCSWIIMKWGGGAVLAQNLQQGQDYYLVNLRTGLILTQDSATGNNVSSWGSRRIDVTQRWRVHEGSRLVGTIDPTFGIRSYAPDEFSLGWQRGDYIKIVNGWTGRGLTQDFFGQTPGENDVLVHHSFAGLAPPGGPPPTDQLYWWRIEPTKQVELVKMTIQSVTCIKASRGRDANTKVLFQAMDDVLLSAVPGGASTKALGKAFYKGGRRAARDLITIKSVLQRLGKDELKRAMGSAGKAADETADSLSEALFTTFYGDGADHLDIHLNGVSVWPSGGRSSQEIESQQTLAPQTEYIFQKSAGVMIDLVDIDEKGVLEFLGLPTDMPSGLAKPAGAGIAWDVLPMAKWISTNPLAALGSGDDILGSVGIDTSNIVSPQRYEDALLHSKAESSVYKITFVIEPVNAEPASQPYRPDQPPSLPLDASVSLDKKEYVTTDTVTAVWSNLTGVTNERLVLKKMERHFSGVVSVSSHWIDQSGIGLPTKNGTHAYQNLTTGDYQVVLTWAPTTGANAGVFREESGSRSYFTVVEPETRVDFVLRELKKNAKATGSRVKLTLRGTLAHGETTTVNLGSLQASTDCAVIGIADMRCKRMDMTLLSGFSIGSHTKRASATFPGTNPVMRYALPTVSVLPTSRWVFDNDLNLYINEEAFSVELTNTVGDKTTPSQWGLVVVIGARVTR